MRFTAINQKFLLFLSTVIILILGSNDISLGSNGDNMDFLNPKPTGNTINDTWSPDGQNFFFAGDGGTILFYDGSAFSIMSTPTQHALFGISGTSMTDVWAVGGEQYNDNITEPGRSIILHYDGSNWTEQSPPSDSWDQYHVFSDVWCDGSGSVWAVAEYTTWIARYNNGSWSYVDTGLSLSNYGFHAIYGFSDTDIYAAGGCGQIIHYSNGVWTKEREEGECTYSSYDLLYDVWEPDASNVFATGNSSQALKRNNDGTWATLFSGDLFNDTSKNSISGASADEIYFAGNSGELDRWDGSNYTRVLSSYSDKTQNVIIRNGTGQYYIGFDYGKVAIFNGSTRTSVTEPTISTNDWKFAQRAERIWLCKAEMNPGDTIYAWDGQTLSAVDPGITAQYRITTFKVFAENDIYLAGYELGGMSSLAKHYNGSTWNDVNIGFSRLVDVAHSGTGTPSQL